MSDPRQNEEPAVTVRSGDVPPTLPAPVPKDAPRIADTFTFSPDATSVPGSRSGSAQQDLPDIPGYEMLEFVAAGGMGMVFRARDITLGREVAIKLPRAGYIVTQQDKERFVREARSAARLRHANICPIFEVREAHNRPYIAMAYIRGLTLKTWCQQKQPGPRQIAELLATVARAVQAAHEEEVIHRDLKPSNVMVESASGEPMLMDFGLAKDLSENNGLTMSGDLVGTPAYMAPEQASGRIHDVGPLSDVYALGAILYELLSGKLPFEGTLAEVLIQVQQAEPVSIRRSNAQVHRDLETICVKAMAKRPAERYASAGALADDLERFARGEPILARRQSLAKRGWRMIQKYPVVWSLVAVLLLVAAGGALALPAISRQLQITRIAGRLQANLLAKDWSPNSISAADSLAAELSFVAPEEAAEYKRQTTERLIRYIDEYLQRPRLDEADRQSIDAAIAALAPRAAEQAEELGRAADRRFGRWERIAELRPPFERAAELLPTLTVRSDGNAIGPLPTKHEPENRVAQSFRSTQVCEGNHLAELTLHIPPGHTGGVLLHAQDIVSGSISALAISPDGRWIAVGDTESGVIRVWDAESAKEVCSLQGDRAAVTDLAFAPQTRQLISVSQGRVNVWDVATRSLLKSANFEGDFKSRGAYFAGAPLALVAEGTQVLVGAGDELESKIVRFKLPNLEPLPALECPGATVLKLSASKDGKRLVAGTLDGKLQFWNLETEQRIWAKAVQQGGVTALAVKADGSQVACTSANGIIRVFDGPTGNQETTLVGLEGGTYSLGYLPSGNTLVAGYEGGLLNFWDPAAGRSRGTMPTRQSRTLALAIDPSGAWGAVGTTGGTVHVWDAASGTERWSLSNQSYAFVVRRHLDGQTATLEIARNGTLLRQVEQSLSPGPTRLIARREHESLQLQVNQNQPLIFTDFFPPRAVEKGVWGLRLSPGAEVTELVIRQSHTASEISPLEIGDREFRAGRFASALERFQEQLAATAAGNQRVREEAQLKSALCLLRLNRTEEAADKLRELAATDARPTPSITLARFQLWLLLARQGQWSAADALAQVVELQHPFAQMAQVVSTDMQQEVFELYARSIARKSSPFAPGSAVRLETTQRLGDYFQFRYSQWFDVKWSLLEGFRMIGKEDQARKLGLELLEEVKRQLPSAELPRSEEKYSADVWARLGFLCRWLDMPAAIEAPLERLIYADGQSLRSDLRGSHWGLVLERARMHAYREEWKQASDLLAEMMTASEDRTPSFYLRQQAGMLSGFALQHLNRSEEALAAWKRLAADPEIANRTEDFDEQSAQDLMAIFLLFGLTDQFDDVLLQRALANLRRRMAPAGGADQFINQFPPSTDLIRRTWRSPRGQALAEEIAKGDRLLTEQFKAFIVQYASQMLQQGAFDEADSEQDEICFQLASDGFDAYTRNQLTVAAFLQLGLAWKGVPPPLGMKFLFASVPANMKAGVAYILGRKFLRRQQPAPARSLFQLAVEFSSPESSIRRLADIELTALAAE